MTPRSVQVPIRSLNHTKRHRAIARSIQRIQHGVRPRRRQAENHPAAQAWAIWRSGIEISAVARRPVHISVASRNNAVRRRARRAAEAECLQNLKARARLADLENGS